MRKNSYTLQLENCGRFFVLVSCFFLFETFGRKPDASFSSQKMALPSDEARHEEIKDFILSLKAKGAPVDADSPNILLDKIVFLDSETADCFSLQMKDKEQISCSADEESFLKEMSWSFTENQILNPDFKLLPEMETAGLFSDIFCAPLWRSPGLEELVFLGLPEEERPKLYATPALYIAAVGSVFLAVYAGGWIYALGIAGATVFVDSAMVAMSAGSIGLITFLFSIKTWGTITYLSDCLFIG